MLFQVIPHVTPLWPLFLNRLTIGSLMAFIPPPSPTHRDPSLMLSHYNTWIFRCTIGAYRFPNYDKNAPAGGRFPEMPRERNPTAHKHPSACDAAILRVACADQQTDRYRLGPHPADSVNIYEVSDVFLRNESRFCILKSLHHYFLKVILLKYFEFDASSANVLYHVTLWV